MSKLERYEVFYKLELIGILTVDTEANKYKYDPRKEGVDAVKNTACLLKVMENGTGFDSPIPFFQNRLMNMKRCGLTQVNYQTDNFTIRLMTE